LIARHNHYLQFLIEDSIARFLQKRSALTENLHKAKARGLFLGDRLIAHSQFFFDFAAIGWNG